MSLLKNALNWNKSHSMISFLDEEGLVVEVEGKVIKSKNGYCIIYNSQFGKSFKNLDAVFYGDESKTGERYYTGDIIDYKGQEVLVDWYKKDDRGVIGVVVDDVFHPVAGFEEDYDVISSGYADETVVSQNYSMKKFTVVTFYAKGNLYYGYNDGTNDMFCMDGQNPMISVLSAVNSILTTNSKSDYLRIKLNNGFLVSMADGSLLSRRLASGNLTFNGTDYSYLKGFFEDYLERLNKVRETKRIEFVEGADLPLSERLAKQINQMM